MSKILNLKKPIITSYPIHADCLSAVGDCIGAMEWFYENYVQLLAHPKGKVAEINSYVNFFAPYPWKSCPCFQFSDIPKKIVQDGWKNVCNFIIDSINQEYYVLLYLDRYYLNGYIEYKHSHLGHDTLIYGYDEINEKFLVADFRDEVYGLFTLKFDDVRLAFLSNRYSMYKCSDFSGIVIFQVDDCNYFKFSISRYKDNIYNFLLSKTEDIQWSCAYKTDYFMFPEEYIYGIEVFEFLKKYIKYVKKQVVSFIDIRGYHVLYDHAVLLHNTLEFLQNKTIVSSPKLLEDSKKIEFMALVFRNKILKLKYTKKCNYNDLINSFDYLTKLEIDLFNTILYELEK